MLAATVKVKLLLIVSIDTVFRKNKLSVAGIHPHCFSNRQLFHTGFCLLYGSATWNVKLDLESDGFSITAVSFSRSSSLLLWGRSPADRRLIRSAEVCVHKAPAFWLRRAGRSIRLASVQLSEVSVTKARKSSREFSHLRRSSQTPILLAATSSNHQAIRSAQRLPVLRRHRRVAMQAAPPRTATGIAKTANPKSAISSLPSMARKRLGSAGN